MLNVQEIAEKPELYIFAKCADSILEKLTYTSTRVEDLTDLQEPTAFGEQVVTDVLRFFIGDHPEIQFEAGNSQGGHYPCLCGTHVSKFSDLEVSSRCRIIGPEKRRQIVMDGPAGKTKKARPFEKMKKEELAKELDLRNWDRELPVGAKRDVLQEELNRRLQGIDRVPAMFYGNEEISAEEMGLAQYEISPSEPLHDIKGHIMNLWIAVPSLLSDTEKEKFQEALDGAYGSKCKVTGADYRLSVITVYAQLKGIVSKDVEELIRTLMVISKLAYQPAAKRSPRSILLLFNTVFVHASLILKLFGKKWFSSKLSNQKLFGIYYHSIVGHFAKVNRTIALSSIYAEAEERMFSFMNAASLLSGRGLESVRDNSIVRLQYEEKVSEKTKPMAKAWNSKISKFSAAQSSVGNTTFKKWMCKGRIFQAHLENLGDYLYRGEGVWWHRDEDDNVVFHDGENEVDERSEGPEMMTFTTCSFESAANFVETMWNKCIDEEVVLPIDEVIIYDAEGNFDRRVSSKGFSGEGEEEREEEHDKNDADVNVEISRVEPPQTELNLVSDDSAPTPHMQIFPRMKANLTSNVNESVDFEEKNLLTSYSSESLDLTDHCKAIYVVLGPSKALTEYEKLYGFYREFKDKKHKARLDRYAEGIITKLQHTADQGKQWISRWEREFYLNHVREPTKIDIENDTKASVVYKKVSVSGKILRKSGQKNKGRVMSSN